MKECYIVTKAGKDVGHINVKRMGLYMVFSGRFTLEANKIWRIIANSDSNSVDLGICLFDSQYYILKKKLPAKLFTGSDYVFTATATDSIKITEDKPFDSLDQLEQGRAEQRIDGLVFVRNSDH